MATATEADWPVQWDNQVFLSWVYLFALSWSEVRVGNVGDLANGRVSDGTSNEVGTMLGTCKWPVLQYHLRYVVLSLR